MPKFEANMNYIPPSPANSMKQCNKSATVKFQMELLLTATTRKQSRSGGTLPKVVSLKGRLLQKLKSKSTLFLRNCSGTQSVSSWFYKETEIKI